MVKRTFQEIRDLLLVELGNSRKTINQLSSEAGINWKTTQHHLTFLIGKQMVSEIFSSPYVRIFELTDNGKKYVDLSSPSNITIIDKGDDDSIVFVKNNNMKITR